MRKSDIEKARQAFMAKGTSTNDLRAKIAEDLDPVRNAYDIATSAWDQVEIALQGVSGEEKPTRALRDLAAAMKDLASVMTLFRQEARETAQYHTSTESAEKSKE